MNITLKENTPLISVNKGTFEGEVNLMNDIRNLSSMAGLVNNQLYWETLKEYKKYRGVYDLEYGDIVLKFRLWRFATSYIIPERRSGTMVNYYQDNFLSSAGYIYRQQVSRNNTIFPAMNKELVLDLVKLFDTLTPYFDSQKIPGNKIEDTRNWLTSNIVLEFYSDWVKHLLNPSRLIDKAVARIKQLPIDENSRVMYNNSLERFNESLAGQIYTFDPVPLELFPWHKRIFLFFK